jgi:hypothetical protein
MMHEEWLALAFPVKQTLQAECDAFATVLPVQA